MRRRTGRGRWRSGCVRAIWMSSWGRSTFWGRARRCGCRLSATTLARFCSGDRREWGRRRWPRLLRERTKADFVEYSAVMAGIKEIKQVMVEAERARQYGTRTIVFIDEIHRFNRAQQDAFLPHVERGNIRLIGATTENPSFEVNSALLSRSRVYTLNPLTEEQIVTAAGARAGGRGARAGRDEADGQARGAGADCGVFERRCALGVQRAGDCGDVGVRDRPCVGDRQRSVTRLRVAGDGRKTRARSTPHICQRRADMGHPGVFRCGRWR